MSVQQAAAEETLMGVSVERTAHRTRGSSGKCRGSFFCVAALATLMVALLVGFMFMVFAFTPSRNQVRNVSLWLTGSSWSHYCAWRLTDVSVHRMLCETVRQRWAKSIVSKVTTQPFPTILIHVLPSRTNAEGLIILSREQWRGRIQCLHCG